MMGERPPPDPLRFGNTINVDSTTGWTDEKHMRYITSLEESFVNQLYNGEIDSKGLFCPSPEVWHKTSYNNGNGSKTKVNQGYWGMLETDGAESRSSQIEYLGSPSCYGFQENSISCYMDYETSTNCPQQERTSNPARSKGSGRFAASHLRWLGHSLPRRTESSGQNFVDAETKVWMNTAEGVERSDRNRKQGLHHPHEKDRDQSDGPCKVPSGMAG